MPDFISSSTRSENRASGICSGDKYHIYLLIFLMQTDERAGSETAHHFRSFQSINVRKGTSDDTGMANQ